MKKITLNDIKNNKDVISYIKFSDKNLANMGYTEHSLAHVGIVLNRAREVLEKLGYDQRICEMAEIASLMHDIGNIINRNDHAQSSAIMAYNILDKMGMCTEEIYYIISAIGHHDEGTSYIVNEVCAALIIADKSDVRRTRVRNQNFATFDIHDRVNYAVTHSEFSVLNEEKLIILDLTIDTSICSLMNYFEIFIDRMKLCRKAADYLDVKFNLIINNVNLT